MALIDYTTNISTNAALIQFIRSTSTGSTIKWSEGYFDVSDYVSKTYTDGSLSTLNASVNLSFDDIDASLNDTTFIEDYVNSSSYYDGSLNLRALKLKSLQLYDGDLSGIKDASGNNGDLFQEDSSVYLKINSAWTHWICTSTAFG